jgi:hypothetical protein
MAPRARIQEERRLVERIVEAIEGGRYSLDFAIQVAIDKYLDRIPLARQERILRRHGLVVRRRAGHGPCG